VRPSAPQRHNPSRTASVPSLGPRLRRAEIIDAALTLFTERGYRSTTMQDVADVLGIRAPSLYNHVSSKHALLSEIMLATMRELIHEMGIALASTGDVAEQLRRATEGHVRYHARHRREAFVGNREIMSLEPPQRAEVLKMRDEYTASLRDVIERGIRQHRFSVASPQLATFAILEMGIGVATWFRSDGPLSESEVAYQYGEFALRLVGSTGRPRRRGARSASPATPD
jgi:AcrR family transcriptional regulator